MENGSAFQERCDDPQDDEQPQNEDELAHDAREHRKPSAHLPEDEAHDRHDEDGRDDEPSTEQKNTSKPFTEVSVRTNPMLNAEDGVAKAFHDTLQVVQTFEPGVHHWFIDWFHGPSWSCFQRRFQQSAWRWHRWIKC